MESSQERQAGVEITPEMIEAGKRIFFEWNENDDPSISNLVIAMIQAVDQASLT